MTQSILLTTKKMLGIAEEYEAFDIDIVIHINAIFLFLNQLGVGPKTPFQITGVDEQWGDFQTEIPGVPSYMYAKVRLLFDPPTNSFLVDSLNKTIQEFEWRFIMQSECGPEKEEAPPEDVSAILYSRIRSRGGNVV